MLHALTASGFTVLRVDTADFDDVTAYAEYQRFTVGDADDNYRMLCSDYSGTAGTQRCSQLTRLKI
jgi:ficolin